MNAGGMSNGLPYAIRQSESTNRTILLFASDTLQGQWLSKLLESAGYRVTTISELKAAPKLPLTDAHVVVVLNSRPHWRIDLVYEICSSLKQAAPKLPLVVVGPNDVDAKVRLFKIGADDYVVEPFDFNELTARINSLIRRQRPGPP